MELELQPAADQQARLGGGDGICRNIGNLLESDDGEKRNDD